jgi:hypothetical protein
VWVRFITAPNIIHQQVDALLLVSNAPEQRVDLAVVCVIAGYANSPASAFLDFYSGRLESGSITPGEVNGGAAIA